jgi:hypothetical protein
MLAMPLETANNMLRRENFKLLPFLRINCNVKCEWRTLHCAFRGIGLFRLAVEHTIAMTNMIVQHYGTETTLAKNFSALLEALQLEIGCTRNPLVQDYEKYHSLAMQSWVKALWERLHHYRFSLHLEYKCLGLPWRNDALLVEMFRQAGFRKQQLQALNWCRITHKLFFLLDMATACG